MIHIPKLQQKIREIMLISAKRKIGDSAGIDKNFEILVYEKSENNQQGEMGKQKIL